MPTLSSEAVQNLVTYCLFKDGEPTDDAIVVEGVVKKMGFHPGRIAEKADEIAALLNELPASFQHDQGGGFSFLQACMDKHGNQWTGFHAIMDDLFCLGIAAKKAAYCLMPRKLWAAFPGGVPYIVIGTPEQTSNKTIVMNEE